MRGDRGIVRADQKCDSAREGPGWRGADAPSETRVPSAVTFSVPTWTCSFHGFTVGKKTSSESCEFREKKQCVMLTQHFWDLLTQRFLVAEDFPKPILITHPEDRFVLRGAANVTLRCAAASTSTAVAVEWRKDSVLVPEKHVTNTGQSAAPSAESVVHYIVR